MARYIDADELKARFANKEGDTFTAFHFYDEIDKTPKAYDVEKVVGQMKKESFQEFCDLPKIVELRDAIEIVRNGGVE